MEPETTGLANKKNGNKAEARTDMSENTHSDHLRREEFRRVLGLFLVSNLDQNLAQLCHPVNAKQGVISSVCITWTFSVPRPL